MYSDWGSELNLNSQAHSSTQLERLSTNFSSHIRSRWRSRWDSSSLVKPLDLATPCRSIVLASDVLSN